MPSWRGDVGVGRGRDVAGGARACERGEDDATTHDITVSARSGCGTRLGRTYKRMRRLYIPATRETRMFAVVPW